MPLRPVQFIVRLNSLYNQAPRNLLSRYIQTVATHKIKHQFFWGLLLQGLIPLGTLGRKREKLLPAFNFRYPLSGKKIFLSILAGSNYTSTL
jgi:hypothetical protein